MAEFRQFLTTEYLFGEDDDDRYTDKDAEYLHSFIKIKIGWGLVEQYNEKINLTNQIINKL